MISQLDVVKADPASFFSDLDDSIVFYPNVGSIDKVSFIDEASFAKQNKQREKRD